MLLFIWEAFVYVIQVLVFIKIVIPPNITILHEPTEGMREEALQEGFTKNAYGQRIQKIQILTIKELLEGKLPDYALPPSGFGKETNRKNSGKSKREKDTQIENFEELSKGNTLEVPFLASL